MSETIHAAQFVARLWSAILPVYRQPVSASDVAHIQQAFRQQFLEQLALPIGDQRPVAQSVALVNGINFQRETNDSAILAAYAAQHRTRVYEGIDTRSDGWFSLVSLQLAGLTRCRVVCSLYESGSGDAGLVPHFDTWFGAIVQMRGSKTWTLWRPGSPEPSQLTTNAGDILLMPPTVQHRVETPHYSAHLVFAIIADEPIV